MRTAFLTVAIVLLFAGPARADIFAVAPVVVPGHSDIDDPSISTDGQQLAFERVDLAGGTDRILETDLTTGQTKDLVNAVEALQYHPTSPAIWPDGSEVSTGSGGLGIFSWLSPGSFFRSGLRRPRPGRAGAARREHEQGKLPALVDARDTGSLSLYEKPVLRVTSLPRFGTLTTGLVSPSLVGLLIQRVVGHHRLLGRRAPTPKPAGRIPLGTFERGRHVIHWRAHLRPGRYQLTPRAVTRSGRIRDLGRPRILRVR